MSEIQVTQQNKPFNFNGKTDDPYTEESVINWTTEIIVDDLECYSCLIVIADRFWNQFKIEDCFITASLNYNISFQVLIFNSIDFITTYIDGFIHLGTNINQFCPQCY